MTDAQWDEAPALPVAIPAPHKKLNIASSANAAKGFYRPELDALRFIAFFLVFLHHIFPREASGYPPEQFGSLGPALAAIADACGFGLSLFFFLSAFLITELLVREKELTGSVGIRRFYERRLLRIWPLYFLCLAIGLGYAFLYGDETQYMQLFSYAGFVGNWYCVWYGWTGNPMTPLWSISIEEQFYLIWPLAVFLLTRRSLLGFAGGIAGLAMVELFVLGSRGAQIDYQVWANTLVQFLMFAAGTLTALLLKGRQPDLGGLVRLGLAGLSVLAWFLATYVCGAKAIGAAHSAPLLMVGYLLIAAGCAALFCALYGIKAKPPSAVVHLGRISYGLYVFHLGAIMIAEKLMQHLHIVHRFMAIPVIMALALPITLAMAELSFRYVEMPFLRMKSRLAVIRTDA